MENNKSTYVMSDEMALGFFDADGSILFGTEYKSYKSGETGISSNVVYYLGQSLSKADAVENFANKFGGKVLLDDESSEFKVNQTSEVGQKVRHPYRLRDFLISEQVILLLKLETNKTILT